MRFSHLFSRTCKDTSRSDVSRNAQLLTRAGYVDKLMAGVYSYLPLGLRVLNKIEGIIRKEMEGLGAQEILMPALQPKDIWEQTGRWETVDILFRFKGAGDRDMTLGPTHEEVVTPLVTSFIRSYRDLPTVVYQIQTKFRNEARAKSGLLRGREFRMKDMYSFHATAEDLDVFYEKTVDAYRKIFDQCGLGRQTLLTYASGGVFSKFSHEFQTITPYGEDLVYRLPGSDLAVNRDIVHEEGVLAEIAKDKRFEDLEEAKAIEVGNIFKLSTRFSDAFGKTYVDGNGNNQKIHMGCYGIGPSRLMGTIAECLSDELGLVWPIEVSPFSVHLVSLFRESSDIMVANRLYEDLLSWGLDVLYDDRQLQAGEKLADFDLIGIPHRLVISTRSLAQDSIEYKSRTSKDTESIKMENLERFVRDLKLI